MNSSSKISHFVSLSGLFSLLVILLALSSCGNSAKNLSENSEAVSDIDTTAVTNDTLAYSPFVIYGVDMNSEAIKNGDFIWMGDLPTTDRPDSSFEGMTLPLTNALITGRKEVIWKLAPNVNAYIIDGKTSTKDDFEMLDAIKIQRVKIDGATLIIETRFSTDEPNPDVKMAVDEESRLYRRSMQK